MKIKQNLPSIFYTFGIVSIIHLVQQSISSDINGQPTEGLIKSILYYPFSFLPFSGFFYFIISTITDLSVFWLLLGYFVSLKNRMPKTFELKESVTYRIVKYLLFALMAFTLIIFIWSIIHFIKNI